MYTRCTHPKYNGFNLISIEEPLLRLHGITGFLKSLSAHTLTHLERYIYLFIHKFRDVGRYERRSLKMKLDTK